MTRMLRPILRSSRSAAIKASSASSSAAAFVPATAAKALASTAQQRLFATQSSGDTEPPTALAKLYLEDGTTLVGKSFGCHESVEGEVSQHVETANICRCLFSCTICNLQLQIVQIQHYFMDLVRSRISAGWRRQH